MREPEINANKPPLKPVTGSLSGLYMMQGEITADRSEKLFKCVSTVCLFKDEADNRMHFKKQLYLTIKAFLIQCL